MHHRRPQCGLGKRFPFLPPLTSGKELAGVLVDLPQEVDHEDWSNPVLEEPFVGVQCILQLQYSLHVGAPIAKQDFEEADIICQHAYKALEGLRVFKLCSHGVLFDIRR